MPCFRNLCRCNRMSKKSRLNPTPNAGNNSYKAVQRSSGAIAFWPILQGLKKPVNGLSRGCLVTDIINTVTITAVQALFITEQKRHR